MKLRKKAHELEFISQIKRDGSGTIKVSEEYLNAMLNNQFMKDDVFKVHCLSISKETYIAIGFNSFVVKLKKQ